MRNASNGKEPLHEAPSARSPAGAPVPLAPAGRRPRKRRGVRHAAARFGMRKPPAERRAVARVDKVDTLSRDKHDPCGSRARLAPCFSPDSPFSSKTGLACANFDTACAGFLSRGPFVCTCQPKGRKWKWLFRQTEPPAEWRAVLFVYIVYSIDNENLAAMPRPAFPRRWRTRPFSFGT